MRLGILQCDSVPAELRDEFGDYPDMFRRLLTATEPALTFRVHDLTRHEFPPTLDDCDAWLFTGSKWSVNDKDAWIRRAEALIVELHRQRRPTVGICFGHQLIARALGGRVEKAGCWGVGVHSSHIAGQQPWMVPAAQELALVVSHQDQVVALPPGAIHLASHSFCPYDMFQVDDHILTFQGHPEFSGGFSRALMDRRRESIGERTYQQGMASLASATDATIAAAWIMRFVQDRAGSRH